MAVLSGGSMCKTGQPPTRHGLAAMSAWSPRRPAQGPAWAGCHAGQCPEKPGMWPSLCRPRCWQAYRAAWHRAWHGMARMPVGTPSHPAQSLT